MISLLSYERVRSLCRAAAAWYQQQTIKYESLKIFNQIKCRILWGFVFSRARSARSGGVGDDFHPKPKAYIGS